MTSRSLINHQTLKVTFRLVLFVLHVLRCNQWYNAKCSNYYIFRRDCFMWAKNLTPTDHFENVCILSVWFDLSLQLFLQNGVLHSNRSSLQNEVWPATRFTPPLILQMENVIIEVLMWPSELENNTKTWVINIAWSMTDLICCMK